MKIQVVGKDIEVAVVVLKSCEVATIVPIPHAIELRGIRHWQRTQKNAVYKRKDRGVRADAKRERQDRGCREARRFAQLAPGVTNVLLQHFKKWQAALHAKVFFRFR